jgi:hypothetical protein
MRIQNFLKNLSPEELVEVRDMANKLIAEEPIKKLIDALVEIKSRGIELTMDGMITMLENSLDAERDKLNKG